MQFFWSAFWPPLWLAVTPLAQAVPTPVPAEPVSVGGQLLSADAVLSPYIYVFYAAFLISFFFTPLMRVVATYYGMIDMPDRIRKMHSAPVAYLGGVAVFLGWMAGMALSQLLQFHRLDAGLPQHPVVHFNLIVAASVIVVLGLWDDIHGVRPRVKIAVQVVAALVLLCWPGQGIGTECARPLLAPIGVRLSLFLGWQPIPEVVIYTASALLVIGMVVGCCNATNLMDGLDGLCGGVTAVIAAGFLFLAVHLAMFEGGVDANTDALRVVMALALLGAVLGFVPFNFNPAMHFHGRHRQHVPGFLLRHDDYPGRPGHPSQVVPGGDGDVRPADPRHRPGLRRRWVNGRPLFSADRHHFHHQMVARGVQRAADGHDQLWVGVLLRDLRGLDGLHAGALRDGVLSGDFRVDHRRRVQNGDGPREAAGHHPPAADGGDVGSSSLRSTRQRHRDSRGTIGRRHRPCTWKTI